LLLAALLAAGGMAQASEPIEQTAREGPVTATLRLVPSHPVIGDALHLELEVVSEPEVELLLPEFGEALDRFTISEFAPSEGLDDLGRTVAVQRYTLQPRRSGPQSIPPLRVEFVDRRPGRAPAPDGEDAYELLTERLAFSVSPVLPDDAPLTLAPALGALPPRARPGPPLWPWFAAAAVVLGAVAPFAARTLLAWRARQRRQGAYDIASSELEALLYGARPSDAAGMDAFFVKLSGIVRRYVESRFALRSPELTTEEFLEALADSPDLLRAQRELLQDFLRRADLVKFAHVMPGSDDVEDSVRAVQRFLGETREGATHPGFGASVESGGARA